VRSVDKLVHDDDLMTGAICRELDKLEWRIDLPIPWTKPKDPMPEWDRSRVDFRYNNAEVDRTREPIFQTEPFAGYRFLLWRDPGEHPVLRPALLARG
jgi:hypothetical protein